MKSEMKKSALFVFCVVVSALGLSACGAGSSAPSSFYVLSTTAEVETQQGLVKAKRQRTIGIGPVTLPAYLDKSQIVTKATRYKLDLAELDQWAEPLKDNVLRVLVEDISILLASDRVHAFPASTSIRDDFQVSVDILAFDCRLKDTCILTARWSVFDIRRNRVVSVKRVKYVKASGRAGYEALARAMSEALAELSRDISRAVGTI